MTPSATNMTDSASVERVEAAIAAALKPYNDHLRRGEHAHEWIARRCAKEAAIAAASLPDGVRVAREALVELANAYETWTKQGASLVPLRKVRAAITTLGEPAQSGEVK